MCPPDQEFLSSYAFHFLQDVFSPAVKLMGVGREIRCSPAYHWENQHRDACHLLQYTLSGSGMVRIGEEYFRTGPETAFLLSFPGDNAYFYPDSATEPWSFVFVLFHGDAALPYLHYILERGGPVFPLPLQHPAAQQMLDLHTMAQSGQLQDAFTAASRMFSLLCALCAPYTDQQRRPSPLVSAAITAMRGSFARGVGIADICHDLGVSQSHLSRTFVRETGIQPILYLTRLRLEEAVHLLNTTDLTLSDISVRCGYDNSNYFSKVFRRHMGMSPRTFRQRLHSQQYTSVQL